MNPLHDITGPVAAFAAGLITSLHCIGMCGPLACSACSKKGGQGSLAATGIYHCSRIFSYSIVGFLAGLIGQRIFSIFLGGSMHGIIWVFAVFFLIVATGLDKRLRLPSVGTFLLRASGANLPLYGQAALFGIFTPLLPCAPLYLVITAAAFSGSSVAGALVMAAFGAGTIPLMLLLQSQYIFFSDRLSPRKLELFRRGLAMASICLLLYRGVIGSSTCMMCH